MLKRMLATFVLLCLIPVFALAEDVSVVVDLVTHPRSTMRGSITSTPASTPTRMTTTSAALISCIRQPRWMS